MATYKRKIDFFETEQGVEVKETLRAMDADNTFNTRSSYISNTELYPDNMIPFVEKHMDYIRSHPMMNPKHYVANLRLTTRIR